MIENRRWLDLFNRFLPKMKMEQRSKKMGLPRFKGSSDQNHFIFEINVGKRRIRHITTLNLSLQPIFSRSRNSPFNIRVVVCRIRLFPTLVSKIKRLGSELPLNDAYAAYGRQNVSEIALSTISNKKD